MNHIHGEKVIYQLFTGLVTTTMRNIFSSSRYLEHHGSLVIKNETLGFVCELNFTESGYFSSSQNEVLGEIKDPQGRKVCNLNGRWNHSLNYFTDDSPDSMNVIWRASSFPSNFRENYGFTQFAIELNELTSDIKDLLPITDTRLRPDQRYVLLLIFFRLYEKGMADEADKEKGRLEQKQREYRKLMEQRNEDWSPSWFCFANGQWKYNPDKDYFESRGKFSSQLNIFDE